ncbi:MAG: hypothetical protein WC856_08025 [Methylococcaceae bacterium]|jgi:hypothetical protein
MGLLNAVVGGIAGGVAGVGAGLTEISKQWNDRDLDAAKQQAEIQKEKRIEEAQGRNRQATLDFNTDPTNVAKSTQAKISGQSAIDEYGDSRFPTELDQAGRLARATHIEGRDTTDYAGRELDHQIKQQMLDEAISGGKVPEGVKEKLKFYDARNKEIKDMLATGQVEQGSKGALSLIDEMKDNTDAKSELLQPYIKNFAPKASGDDVDPLGIKRDALMSEIERITGIKQDLSSVISLSDLQKIVDDAKKTAHVAGPSVTDEGAIPRAGLLTATKPFNRSGVTSENTRYSGGRGSFIQPDKAENADAKEAMKKRKEQLQKGSSYR